MAGQVVFIHLYLTPPALQPSSCGCDDNQEDGEVDTKDIKDTKDTVDTINIFSCSCNSGEVS